MWAYDVVRMLQRDGHLTPLGDAIASYGRNFKSLHILTYVDDETYRPDIEGVSRLLTKLDVANRVHIAILVHDARP